MLKKLLWTLAPVIASKLLGKRQSGRGGTKYSGGKSYGKNYGRKRR